MDQRKEGVFSKIKIDVYTLWYAIRDPKTPKSLKFFAILVCAYAFSPIDLIPDFIPVLGLIDDLVLIPLGVYLIFRFMPETILEQSRIKAKQHLEHNLKAPKSKAGVLIILIIWFLMAFVAYHLITTVEG